MFRMARAIFDHTLLLVPLVLLLLEMRGVMRRLRRRYLRRPTEEEPTEELRGARLEQPRQLLDEIRDDVEAFLPDRRHHLLELVALEERTDCRDESADGDPLPHTGNELRQLHLELHDCHRRLGGDADVLQATEIAEVAVQLLQSLQVVRGDLDRLPRSGQSAWLLLALRSGLVHAPVHREQLRRRRQGRPLRGAGRCVHDHGLTHAAGLGVRPLHT